MGNSAEKKNINNKYNSNYYIIKSEENRNINLENF